MTELKRDIREVNEAIEKIRKHTHVEEFECAIEKLEIIIKGRRSTYKILRKYVKKKASATVKRR